VESYQHLWSNQTLCTNWMDGHVLLLLLPPALSLFAFFFELAPSPSAAFLFLFSSTTSFQALTIDLARVATDLRVISRTDDS
jgi:hypothetical protein